MTLSFQMARQAILPLIFHNATNKSPQFSLFSKAFLSSSSKHSMFAPISTEEKDELIPEALNVLKDAYKFRINQLRLQRIIGTTGVKPIEQECIREFGVVDTLKNNQKLLFIHLHHAINVEKYAMSAFLYSSEFGGSGEGPCLLEMKLERDHRLKGVAARIYSPPERPIAYVYDLVGVYRTAIVEDGTGIRCIYQIFTNSPHCWTTDGKIYNSWGKERLGHFVKLKTDKDYKETKKEIMLFVRLHQELDIKSKCILLGAALYLMSYEDVG